MHSFQIGDRVSIINCMMGGRFFFEGRAVIMDLVDGVDEQYEVEFDNGDLVERFVDPQAQECRNEDSYIAELNRTTN